MAQVFFQVINIVDGGECLAIKADGKEERTLSLPRNAMGKSVSLLCSFMNEYMGPDAFFKGENVITKVPCHAAVLHILARSLALTVHHGVR